MVVVGVAVVPATVVGAAVVAGAAVVVGAEVVVGTVVVASVVGAAVVAAVVVGTAVVVALVGAAVVVALVGTAVVAAGSVVGSPGSGSVVGPGSGSVVGVPGGTENMSSRQPGTPDLTMPQKVPFGQFPLGKPPTQMGIGAHSVVPISTETGSSPGGQLGSSGLSASALASRAKRNTVVDKGRAAIACVYTMANKKHAPEPLKNTYYHAAQPSALA